jgi:riboflavin kinase/FMN adenylyltransferase
MRVVPGIDALDRSVGRLFVVVGVFDGLHLGHEYLLRELARSAFHRDAAPAVVTFDHHPEEVLLGKAPPLLCDPAERLARLEAAGVAVTVVQTFDVALRETPFEEFVRRIADRVDLAGFLMTPESAFGYQRAGTPESVAALGHAMGYDVEVVPQFTLDGEPVQSSDIRAAIAAGDLARAEALLGRPYAIAGAIEEDPDGTENLLLRPGLPVAVPPAGIYPAAFIVSDPDAWDDLKTEVAVGRDGRIWLLEVIDKEPLRVAFQGPRIPGVGQGPIEER